MTTYRKILMAAALLAAAGAAHAATDYPTGYIKCAKEGETCSFTGTRSVAYGKSGTFVYATLTGPITCSGSLFPPISVDNPRYCSYSSSGTSGSSSSSTSSSGGSSGISLAASAGDAQVALSWSYTSGSAGTQEVYRDTDSDPSGRVRIASVSTSTRAYTATGLTNGTTYYFWIKNTLNGVVSNSNAASATPTGGTSSSSSSSSSGGGTITGATCTSTGSVSVSSTILVTSGTYDGGCRTYNPTSALGDGSQDEGQQPAFRVENGATLRNAILGNNGVDGVHFYNGGNLQNFRWLNVGEDAFTIKSSGTVNISGVTGVNGEDKFGQINAASTLNISNCIVDNMAKFIRQNGGTTFKIVVNADRCQISNMGEGVFRSDSSSSEARLTNSRLRNSGSLCIGNWAVCTGSGNTNY
jgi:pectate lyase C